MHVLLTNDDSHTSPLFHFLIDQLRPMAQLTIVVPMEEQSWTGKAITRFGYLYMEAIRLGDVEAYCVDGTPADCINLGLHHVTPRKPDLVVSGINIGINAGLGFVLSSGTVGACLEANLAGVPAIALSQSLSPATFQQWGRERRFPPEERERLRLQTQTLLARVFDHLLGRDDFWHRPVTWNVNLPEQAAPNWRLVPARLGHTTYGSCFKRYGDRFQHEIERLCEDPRAETDSQVVRQGHVSLTCIDVWALGQSLA